MSLEVATLSGRLRVEEAFLTVTVGGSHKQFNTDSIASTFQYWIAST
jgi:hypothetical protein